MLYPLSLCCYLRDGELLFPPGVVEPFFAELVARGYHVVAEAEMGTTFDVWWQTHQGHAAAFSAEQQRLAMEVFQAGLSYQARAALDDFLARRAPELKLRAYHVERVLEFNLILDPNSSTVTAEVDRDYLTDVYGESSLQAYERWLEVVKLLYYHVHPFYGWTFDQDFEPSCLSPTDALLGRVEALTLINIFGPEVVQRYGRDHLLATPAWRIDTLDDGGLLLLPEPYWEGYAVSWKEALLHLGMPTHTFRYVAHLAFLLHHYQVLPSVSVERLRKATAQPCVLLALQTLVPTRCFHYRRTLSTEEQFNEVLLRAAGATAGEWAPEHLCTTIRDHQVHIEFDFQGQHHVWKVSRFRLPERRADGAIQGYAYAWDLHEQLANFAQTWLSGRFVLIETSHAPDEDYILYLLVGMITALGDLLQHLKSGWPSVEELCRLFSDSEPAAWEQVVPRPGVSLDITSRHEPSPCCDAYRIESCRLVRQGLLFCRGWQ